jgi:hypothetical protein
MTFLLLRRLVVPTAEKPPRYRVTEQGFDTALEQDVSDTVTQEGDPGPFSQPVDVRAGFYCHPNGERVDVFHAAALNGTSRRTFTANATECPVPPPPGGGGTTSSPLNDPAAPIGAKLLERRYKPAVNLQFSYVDRYYDPGIRSVVTVTNATIRVPASVATDYVRPAGELLDRWCLAIGTPPFTERKVFSDGDGNITTTDTDNVQSCALPACTLGLAVTTLTPSDSTQRGSALLAAVLPQGAVRYSLGNAQAVGQPSPFFDHLRAGRYTAYAYETRLGGCRASVDFTITSPYGLRYRVPFVNPLGQACEVQLERLDYTGEPVVLTGQGDPAAVVELDYPEDTASPGHPLGGVLRGSSLDIRINLLDGEDVRDLYSADERYIRVTYFIAGAQVWRGWLLPEQYEQAYVAPPVPLLLRATDGLGALAYQPFADPSGNHLTGVWTVLRVVQHCLGLLQTDILLAVRDRLLPTTAAQLSLGSLEQASVDVGGYVDDKGAPLLIGKVLRELLEGRGCRLYLSPITGCWHWERLADLEVTPMPYRLYDLDGTTARTDMMVTLHQAIGNPHQDNGPFWLNGEQSQGLHPAVSLIHIATKPGTLLNLLGTVADFAEADFLGPRLLAWQGGAPVQRIAPVKKGDPTVLRLLGATPGLGPTSAKFIQSPPTPPIVSHQGDAFLIVRFTATLRSTEIVPTGTPFPLLPVLRYAVQQGGEWLGDSFSGNSTTQVLTSFVRFEDGLDVAFVLRSAYGRVSATPAPVVLRFYQMTAPAGHPRYDVDIQDLRIEYAAYYGGEEDYDDAGEISNDAFFTRKDDGLTLFHTDTPSARLNGTWLGPNGLPVPAWREYSDAELTATTGIGTAGEQPDAPTAPLLALLLRDRMLWQQRPQYTLRGSLQGAVSPGGLLSDPTGDTPAVYLITSARRVESQDLWHVEATQILTLTAPSAPVVELPDGTLLTDDGRPLLSPSLAYLTVDHV